MLSRKNMRNIVIIVVVSLFAATLLSWQMVFPSNAKETNTVYLPFTLKNFPPKMTVFGAESWEFTDPDLIKLAVNAGVSWIRIPAFDWSLIEPDAPVGDAHTYDWSKVPETSLLNISSNHMYAIATVKMTPTWAQKHPGWYCGPMAQEYFEDFAMFLQAAVQRYSGSPYNIHYWELGNEPDVDRNLLTDKRSVFGCWGDENDYFYGGRYYADMLKVVYPAIKAADPNAQVLIGGLLLDCDPDDTDCNDPKLARFLEGVLHNGGGPYFDMVSFHGYPSFVGGQIHDENFSKWDQRGGVVIGKANYLLELVSDFGFDKPLLHTEGALLCPETNLEDCNPPGAEYEQVKADYVVWLFARTLANDFEGSVWYTLDGGGWRNGGLIGDLSNPNPAYDAFKFMTRILADAQYIGEPFNYGNGLRSYAFDVDGKTVWVVLSVDGITYPLTLPNDYTKVYDREGNEIVITGEVVDVKSPIYIEIP